LATVISGWLMRIAADAIAESAAATEAKDAA
jgi:hypothetical protein